MNETTTTAICEIPEHTMASDETEETAAVPEHTIEHIFECVDGGDIFFMRISGHPADFFKVGYTVMCGCIPVKTILGLPVRVTFPHEHVIFSGHVKTIKRFARSELNSTCEVIRLPISDHDCPIVNWIDYLVVHPQGKPVDASLVPFAKYFYQTPSSVTNLAMECTPSQLMGVIQAVGLDRLRLIKTRETFKIFLIKNKPLDYLHVPSRYTGLTAKLFNFVRMVSDGVPNPLPDYENRSYDISYLALLSDVMMRIQDGKECVIKRPHVCIDFCGYPCGKTVPSSNQHCIFHYGDQDTFVEYIVRHDCAIEIKEKFFTVTFPDKIEKAIKDEP